MRNFSLFFTLVSLASLLSLSAPSFADQGSQPLNWGICHSLMIRALGPWSSSPPLPVVSRRQKAWADAQYSPSSVEMPRFERDYQEIVRTREFIGFLESSKQLFETDRLVDQMLLRRERLEAAVSKEEQYLAASGSVSGFQRGVLDLDNSARRIQQWKSEIADLTADIKTKKASMLEKIEQDRQWLRENFFKLGVNEQIELVNEYFARGIQSQFFGNDLMAEVVDISRAIVDARWHELVPVILEDQPLVTDDPLLTVLQSIREEFKFELSLLHRDSNYRVPQSLRQTVGLR
jgi:hypothetical protein